MADYPRQRTVLDELTARGYLEHDVRRHLRYHRVSVDGEPVTEPMTVLLPEQMVVLLGALIRTGPSR